MTDERKPPTRHPSTAIPADVIEEISYRVYLRRLEPPLSPEESRTAPEQHDTKGKVTSSDAIRNRRARSMDPLTREYLRALVDMGLFDDAILTLWMTS